MINATVLTTPTILLGIVKCVGTPQPFKYVHLDRLILTFSGHTIVQI